MMEMLTLSIKRKKLELDLTKEEVLYGEIMLAAKEARIEAAQTDR